MKRSAAPQISYPAILVKGDFMDQARFGVMGGSGLYALELEDARAVYIDTPFGAPSDAVMLGRLEGVPCAFLARHGRGHRFSPSEINFRANIWALKSLGVESLLSVSAVGSLKEDIRPGHLVLVDQFFDRTVSRARSFFGEGCVAHVQFGSPVEEALRKLILEAARDVSGTVVHDGGTYVCIEGPTFSTRAESEWFRSMGCAVVGMTNLPEARLAREAEIAYATLALATDYDCWHVSNEEVSVEAVVRVIQQNVEASKRVICETVRRYAALGPVSWPSHSALQKGAALSTAVSSIPNETRAKLDLLLGKYLWPSPEEKN